jgi:TonB family protein
MQGENYEPQINLAGLDARSHNNRGRQMSFAFVLLLTALILLVVRYRTYWFDSLSSQGTADQASSAATQESERLASPTTSRKVSAKQHASSPSLAEAETAEASSPQEAVLLPPLQVDVTYSNGRHQTLVASDTAVHLNFSPETAEALVQPVDPVYPLLAQQSNVQGSVVLLARIGKDGNVESVQVVSGPDILANAALEAVRQWRFKPRSDAGAATPAETRITVNFTISTP